MPQKSKHGIYSLANKFTFFSYSINFYSAFQLELHFINMLFIVNTRHDYTLQIVCIFFVCEEANKTLNYLRLIANKANKIQRPIKIKIKASIKVPPALKRHFC